VSSLSRFEFLLTREVDVVESVSGEGAAGPEPWECDLIPLGFGSAVFLPLNFGLLAEDIGFDEGADVHAYSVVDVGVPADGPLGEWFPGDEAVVGSLGLCGGPRTTHR
jgi:hypothetical protein